MEVRGGTAMDRKSERVAGLTAKAAASLRKGHAESAEAYYKQALAEGIRLLGLHHSVTRDVLSHYSVYLWASHRIDEAIRYEALYWKTAPPESYRLGVLFGSVESDVQEFLDKNADWVENWGRQMSLDSRNHTWIPNWARSVLVTVRKRFQSIRQHVTEMSK
jgi:hypothetical protein